MWWFVPEPLDLIRARKTERMASPCILNWSGGKDSALVLHRLQHDSNLSIRSLFSTVNKGNGRVAMHELPEDLLYRQAEALGLPLRVLHLPEQPAMEVYNRMVEHEMLRFKNEGVSHSIYGDIFLQDLREYREKQVTRVGLEAGFPLWHEDTRQLMMEFVELGFKAVVISINAGLLDGSFLGRELAAEFVEDLPAGVDPCGENGEFHTYVYDGPGFKGPVSFQKGKVFERSFPSPEEKGRQLNFRFLDLL